MANSTPRRLSALWHATPIDNLPAILSMRKLLASPQWIPANTNPTPARRTRRPRHRPEGVYLALEACTPFVEWHRQNKIPVVQLLFAPDLIRHPDTALVRCNGKAWRHRDDFNPVQDPVERTAILEEWASGKWRSLECLIPRELNLDRHWIGMAFPTTQLRVVNDIVLESGIDIAADSETLRRWRGKLYWAQTRVPAESTLCLFHHSVDPGDSLQHPCPVWSPQDQANFRPGEGKQNWTKSRDVVGVHGAPRYLRRSSPIQAGPQSG